MWSTIFISITSHILGTFYFKFSIIYTQSSIIQFLYHFYFFCIFHMKEGCHCSLVERLLKKQEKFSIYFLLSSQPDYPRQHTIWIIDNWRKMLFCYKSKVFVTHSVVFSLKKSQKGNTLNHSFLLKNLLKVKWETPKQDNSVLI